MTTTFNSDTDSTIAWEENSSDDFSMGLSEVEEKEISGGDTAAADTSNWEEDREVLAKFSRSDTLDEIGLTGYSKTLTDDAVGAFFKEMARYPLLSPAEEIELARQVRFLSKVDTATEKLTKELGRKPNQAELLARMNVSEAEFRQKLHQGRTAKTAYDSLQSAAGGFNC